MSERPDAPRDFTFEAYRDLLEGSLDGGYDVLTVRDYLADALPERFVVLRHDVDRKPENALAMARLEADLGVSSTYYFRTVDATLDPDVVRGVASLGHEVGYHYEDLDRANGDVAAALASFETELGRLREVCPTPVETACMHGNPLTPYDNREMWRGGVDFDRYGLLGEAYLSMDFADVAYYSDTGRTWRDGVLKVKDHTMGEGSKPVSVATTRELAAVLRERRVDRLCLLAHPDRWAETVPELLAGRLRDATLNTGKRVLALLS